MGMKSVRMSRKNHPMPTMAPATHRAASTYSDGQRPLQPEKPHSVHSMVPKKEWPDTISHRTPPPHSYAWDGGKEGPVRGRQADKSSKTK